MTRNKTHSIGTPGRDRFRPARFRPVLRFSRPRSAEPRSAEHSVTPRRFVRVSAAFVLSLSLFFIGCAGEDSAVASVEDTDVAATAAVEAPPPVHPAFDLTEEEVQTITVDLPIGVQRKILRSPERFLELVDTVIDREPIVTRLVDKTHLLPAEYAPTDLVELDEHRDTLVLNRDDLSLRSVILPDLFAMVEAAAMDGVTLDISSSYRSYAYQEWLFQYWVDELGLEEAERVSARPGSSQHQLGTTVDFGSVTPEYADTAGGKWLAEHAWRFGFSLSYPDGWEATTGYAYEPWHFRWISRDATALEREFFDGIQQVMLEFLHRHRETFELARSGR